MTERFHTAEYSRLRATCHLIDIAWHIFNEDKELLQLEASKANIP